MNRSEFYIKHPETGEPVLVEITCLSCGDRDYQKTVKMNCEGFPWEEIESLAIDLQSKGYRFIDTHSYGGDILLGDEATPEYG